MGKTDRRPFDGKDPIGIIVFLRTFWEACFAVGTAEGAAIYFFQWVVSAEVLTVIRRVLTMGSGNVPGGSLPSFRRVLKEVREENLDEKLRKDSLRALQTARQHA